MFFIRTASIRDIDRIRPVLLKTWHDTYDAIYGSEKVDDICRIWHSVEMVKRNIEERHGEYIVADNGETIAGIACVKGPNKDGIAYLGQLYVLPDYQRQGIGHDLLNEVEVSFEDVKTIRLGIDAQNIKAIGFYEHFGYKNTNIRMKEDGLEALIFEKYL